MSLIDQNSYTNPKFLELQDVLIEWINDELASQRIIVQDLKEDLYDGQVLQKLLEKLTGDKLDVPEVTQNEEGQKQKLAVVLAHFNKVKLASRQTWAKRGFPGAGHAAVGPQQVEHGNHPLEEHRRHYSSAGGPGKAFQAPSAPNRERLS